MLSLDAAGVVWARRVELSRLALDDDRYTFRGDGRLALPAATARGGQQTAAPRGLGPPAVAGSTGLVGDFEGICTGSIGHRALHGARRPGNTRPGTAGTPAGATHSTSTVPGSYAVGGGRRGRREYARPRRLAVLALGRPNVGNPTLFTCSGTDALVAYVPGLTLTASRYARVGARPLSHRHRGLVEGPDGSSD